MLGQLTAAGARGSALHTAGVHAEAVRWQAAGDRPGQDSRDAALVPMSCRVALVRAVVAAEGAARCHGGGGGRRVRHVCARAQAAGGAAVAPHLQTHGCVCFD